MSCGELPQPDSAASPFDSSGARAEDVLDANKRAALALFDAISAADIDLLASLVTEDLKWWVSPSTIFSGTYDKQAWLANFEKLFANAAGPIRFRFDDITGEADRVCLTAKGNMPLTNGDTYASDYHFLLFFRDGKVSHCKEYLDSAHVSMIFGAPTPPGLRTRHR